MDNLADIGEGAIACAAYGAVALAAVVAGYFLVDVLTPGKLGVLIYHDRNVNAVIVTSASILGTAIITATAIFTSDATNLGYGVLSAAVFTAIGLVVLALSFFIVDRMIPVDLGDLIADAAFHPAVWVTAATHLGLGLAVAAVVS